MRLAISLLATMLFFSCGQEKTPDVSAVKIELTTQRFDKELFLLDSNSLASQLDLLIAKYPSFGENFLYKILELHPMLSPDSAAMDVKRFISGYRYVYDSAKNVFPDFTAYENDIRKGLQFVHHYFPGYKIPRRIITYIGPIEGTANGISDDALLIGLQAYLGKDFSWYRQPWVQEVYAGYITDRFEPSYIPVNCMKNIVLDIYPEKEEDQALIIQMVEKGKRLYLLSKLLPAVPEYKLIGYTEKQLKDCYKQEAIVWNMFIQNNILQVTDNNITKNYISEGPKTQELGEDAPGNIGSFAGWQIVKKFMNKNQEVTLQQLVNTPAENIYEQSKYKP